MLGRKNKRDRQRPQSVVAAPAPRLPVDQQEMQFDEPGTDEDADSVSDVDRLSDLEMDTEPASFFDEMEAMEPTKAQFNPTPSAALQANLGRSVTIKGELAGDEDLAVDGTVEGTISLRGHRLTIEAHGMVVGEMSARTVRVFGNVVGDIRAEERIEVLSGGKVEGDLIAPTVVLAEGARFKGNIDMLAAAPAAPAGARDRDVATPTAARDLATPASAFQGVQGGAAPAAAGAPAAASAAPDRASTGKTERTAKSGRPVDVADQAPAPPEAKPAAADDKPAAADHKPAAADDKLANMFGGFDSNRS